VCNISRTSEPTKVVRQWCALCILTSKCASRHNGVHFFDIATSKSGPTMVCFVHFDLEMCFSSVHIVGSLTSKLPSIKLSYNVIYRYYYRYHCTIKNFMILMPVSNPGFAQWLPNQVVVPHHPAAARRLGALGRGCTWSPATRWCPKGGRASAEVLVGTKCGANFGKASDWMGWLYYLLYYL